MKKGLEQLQKGKGVRTKMLNIKDILSFIVFQSRAPLNSIFSDIQMSNMVDDS